MHILATVMDDCPASESSAMIYGFQRWPLFQLAIVDIGRYSAACTVKDST